MGVRGTPGVWEHRPRGHAFWETIPLTPVTEATSSAAVMRRIVGSFPER